MDTFLAVVAACTFKYPIRGYIWKVLLICHSISGMLLIIPLIVLLLDNHYRERWIPISMCIGGCSIVMCGAGYLYLAIFTPY